jgi:hypothetical protein
MVDIADILCTIPYNAAVLSKGWTQLHMTVSSVVLIKYSFAS